MDKLNEQPTDSNPIENLVSAELVVELINILLNSATQFHDGVVQHEHQLFDSVDERSLKKLRDELTNSH